MSILQESAAAAAADGKAQAPPQIDLATCAPDELSAWLLAHRFEDNAMDVASFLLNCTSTLPNAEEISAQLMGGGGDDDDEEMEDGENEADASGEGGGEAEPASATDVDPQTALLNSIQRSQPHPAFAHQNGNEVEVSCTNPRGKFVLSLREGGIVLTNPKKRDEEQIPIGPDNVSHVVWFRKPEEYKKLKQVNKNGTAGKKPLPGHMVLICLKEDGEDGGAGIKFRNKPLGQVCFQLPSYPPPSEETDNDDNKQLTEAAWWEGLSAALFSDEKGGIVRVHAAMDAAKHTKGKGGFVFRSEGESGSATTTEGMPYVGCYQGFNDGALFPLREGLLFFKPPLFVPRSTLASISCGRGSGGSRYVDMVVQLDVPESDEQDGAKKKQSDTLEFTNIHRDELNGLNDYIHKTLIPAMQADADGESSSSDDDEEAVAEMVNSDEDESGSADEESIEVEEEEVGRKRRSSRAASKSAREITRAALNAGADGDDDSDDDSDVFEEEDATDSDGSDDDESDASSDDGGFDEEADDSDDESDCEGRMKKKARVD